MLLTFLCPGGRVGTLAKIVVVTVARDLGARETLGAGPDRGTILGIVTRVAEDLATVCAVGSAVVAFHLALSARHCARYALT